MRCVTLLIIPLLKEVTDNGRKQIMLYIKREQCLFDTCTHFYGGSKEADRRSPTADGRWYCRGEQRLWSRTAVGESLTVSSTS